MHEPGQYIMTIPSKKGDVVLRVRKVEDAAEFMKLINDSVANDYIPSKYNYTTIESAEKVLKKRLKTLKKGNIFLSGEIDGKFILIANMLKKKITTGKYKGKYAGEVGIVIKEGYKHIGIGGKILDYFIKTAKKQGFAYIFGEFFSENFDSLVLCKSRSLNVYRVDRNKPERTGWKEEYHKWDKYYDRVRAKIFVNS